MPGWTYAFSLSSEAVKGSTPPGTVRLIGKKDPSERLCFPVTVLILPEHSVSQHGGRYLDRIIYYPLPTADPADPLNWATWRKTACVTTVAFYAFVANFISASIAPALPLWNLSFPHDPKPVNALMELVAVCHSLTGPLPLRRADEAPSSTSCRSASGTSSGSRCQTSLGGEPSSSCRPCCSSSPPSAAPSWAASPQS